MYGGGSILLGAAAIPILVFSHSSPLSFDGSPQTGLEYGSLPLPLSTTLTLSAFVNPQAGLSTIISLGRGPDNYEYELMFMLDFNGYLSFWDASCMYGSTKASVPYGEYSVFM